MPFGVFPAQLKAPVAKPIPEPKPKPQPQPRPRPTPPPPPPVDIPATSMTEINHVDIGIVARNIGVIQDFLCSMYQNATEALHREGLALSTQELTTITEVVGSKKRLEQYFWEGSRQWLCKNSDQEKRYTFCVNPAADQKSVLTITLHCAAAPALPTGWEGMHALWLLTDGAMFRPDSQPDAYYQFLQGVLNRSGCKKSLILTQIETMGHFSTSGGCLRIPERERKPILQACARIFGQADGSVDVFPVQVYGGLEFSGFEEGSIVLTTGKSGYYQSYIPQFCHIPLLTSLREISNSMETPLLTVGTESVLVRAINTHFDHTFRNETWKPDTLGGIAE